MSLRSSSYDNEDKVNIALGVGVTSEEYSYEKVRFRFIRRYRENL